MKSSLHPAKRSHLGKRGRRRQPTKPAALVPGPAPLEIQRALADPRAAKPATILALQHMQGNRAIQRMLDRPSGRVRREAAPQDEDVHMKPDGGTEGGTLAPELADAIQQARGGGQALDGGARAQLEPAFGTDFSGVRVHTDAQADQLNRSLSAKAFTLGGDIFFRGGNYDPGSAGGRELLAHELTHVVQQGGGQAGPVQAKLTVGPAGDAYEQEADRVAQQVTRVPSAGPLTAVPARQAQRASLKRDAVIQRFKLFGIEFGKKKPKASELLLESGPKDKAGEAGTTGTKETTDKEKAQSYLKAILAGGNHKTLGITQKDMLDVMQAHLSDDEFASAAAVLMLSMPGTVVESEEARKKALDILRIELHDKGIARRMLDQNVSVVVIPRNKKMTDLVEFSKLKGTKTFDGRAWDEVRGAGGFKVPGESKVYVAVAEENLTGASAEGGAAGTQWCYDKGYSTASHEMAHAVDLFGLSPEDKKLVDDEYKKKKDKEAKGGSSGKGEPQEWIDGYNTATEDGKKIECYASVHRAEYFAQTANAYFGTNAGSDPFTVSRWTALKLPEKAKRRNGKPEVARVEPEVYKLMQRIFGDKDIKDANPRKDKK